MSLVAHDWKLDLVPDEYQEKVATTKNSISRYVKSNVERRITSSSSSDRVITSDCCWATPNFMLSALSNGSVCMLNVSNLAKVYLFEPSLENSGHHSNKDRHRSAHRSNESSQVAAIDSCPVGQKECGKVLLCVAMDGSVQLCVVDTTSMSELRKLNKGSSRQVLPFPTMADGALIDVSVRFSPSADQVLAVVHYGVTSESSSEGSTTVTRFCCFKHDDEATAAVEVSRWSAFSAEREQCGAVLRYCGWWDDQKLLCVWSDGIVQLYDGHTGNACGEAQLFGHGLRNCVTLATATNGIPSVRSEADSQMGYLSVAAGYNIVITVAVCTMDVSCGKRVKTEGGAVATAGSQRILLRPTQQTYCTEDVPIRHIALFHSFSWSVCILLESGAVLFVDAQTMELLVHRPVRRIGPTHADYQPAHAPALVRRDLFLNVMGRPLSIAVIERNTVTLLKP